MRLIIENFIFMEGEKIFLSNFKKGASPFGVYVCGHVYMCTSTIFSETTGRIWMRFSLSCRTTLQEDFCIKHCSGILGCVAVRINMHKVRKI